MREFRRFLGTSPRFLLNAMPDPNARFPELSSGPAHIRETLGSSACTNIQPESVTANRGNRAVIAVRDLDLSFVEVRRGRTRPLRLTLRVYLFWHPRYVKTPAKSRVALVFGWACWKRSV
jgi:hypothetical protein